MGVIVLLSLIFDTIAIMWTESAQSSFTDYFLALMAAFFCTLASFVFLVDLIDAFFSTLASLLSSVFLVDLIEAFFSTLASFVSLDDLIEAFFSTFLTFLTVRLAFL